MRIIVMRNQLIFLMEKSASKLFIHQVWVSLFEIDNRAFNLDSNFLETRFY